MRIVVTNWSRRIAGGTEGYLDSVLSALAARGAQVALWTEQDAPNERSPIRPPIGAPDWCADRIGLAAALANLRRWRPHLVYGHGLHGAANEHRILDLAPGVFFAHAYHGICVSGTKTFTRPHIEACHRPFGLGCLGCYYPRRCGGRNPVVALRLYRSQARRLAALRRYARIVTHSHYVAAEYRRNELPAEVLTYAIDAPAESTPPAPLPASGHRTLVFAGRMDRLKGGHVLLEALPAIVAALRQPIRLFMVGDGPDRPRWEILARTVSAAHPVEIRFPGWADRARLDELLASADLAVVPSLWPEPFGKVGPEASAWGVPVSAFDVGGVREWLHDGVNGHLAPGEPPTAAGLADAIVRCLADSAHHRQLRAAARAAAARFRMVSHLDELQRVFEGVLGRTSLTGSTTD